MDQETTANGNASNTETDTSSVASEQEETVSLSKFKDIEESNRQLFERAKKAEGFVKVDGKWVKAPRAEDAIRSEAKLEATTGELGETQLDYLDLKGINHEDDIAIIQKVMRNTGQTVRQALADDYVKSKLETAQKAREVQNAMPGSTKRGGSGASDSVELAHAKWKATGELPSDFKLRSAVINAEVDKTNVALPPWKRQ